MRRSLVPQVGLAVVLAVASLVAAQEVKPLHGSKAIQAILSHGSVRTLGSLPEGVSAPPAKLCQVRGIKEYAKTHEVIGACTRQKYVTACANATANHVQECRDHCGDAVKESDASVACTGIADPQVDRPFDPSTPAVFCGTDGTGQPTVTCTVRGACLCDP